MQLEEVIKYIEDPQKLNEYSLSELRALIKKYPYFHLTYSLLLLNLKNISDPRYEEFIAKYAIFTKDRHELFRKLNFLELNRDEKKDVESEDDGIEKAGDSTDSTDEGSENQKEEKSKQQIEGKKAQKQPYTKPSKRTEEKSKKEYTRAYLGSRISDTLTKQIDETDQKGSAENNAENEFFILDKASKIKGAPENEPGEKSESKAPSEEVTDSQEMFELEEKGNKETTAKSEEKKKETNNIKKSPDSQYFDENDLKEIYKKADSGDKDLIDQFLIENPELKVKEPKIDENRDKKDDISEESIQEKEDFLSEKLANVYIKQGYYEKAIRAFEKLSLKYPKKSDYFAEQIEKIKQIINEQ